jgi:hypothetical protein
MAYLVIRNVKGGRYFYIAKSARKNGKVVQKTLEYLGHEPDPARLRRALEYWQVGTKRQGKARKGER